MHFIANTFINRRSKRGFSVLSYFLKSTTVSSHHFRRNFTNPTVPLSSTHIKYIKILVHNCI